MYACMYIDGWKYKVATNECFALLRLRDGVRVRVCMRYHLCVHDDDDDDNDNGDDDVRQREKGRFFCYY